MCCPLDQQQIRFHSVVIAERPRAGESSEYIVTGVIDYTPESIQDRAIRAFQHLELIEKIAEFTEQLFHFIEIPLKRFASLPLYQALHKLHHNAHEIEHFLHAACFLGDILCILTCNYLQYEDQAKTRLDYYRTAARMAHTAAHFFATAAYLSKYNICQFGVLDKIFKFGPMLTAVGYALATYAILSDKYYKNIENRQFYSDLGIHLGGFAFEAIPIVQSLQCLESISKILEISTAIVGMIHSWCVINRLVPQQQQVRGVSNGIVVHHHHHHRGSCHEHH